MCNLFVQNTDHLPGCAEHADYKPARRADDAPAGERFPKRRAVILRNVTALELVGVPWGFERVIPGKRPGTTRKTVVTNVRNLASPFWRPMLADPGQRCLVHFSSFAEPVMGAARANHCSGCWSGL